jgi:hemerythrin
MPDNGHAMQWSDAYATGVERIDRQHKMLFRMSEDFRISLDEGGGERVYGAMLNNLGAYARGHFGAEEQCMDQCHCPVADQNREAHATFIESLGQFQQRYALSGFSRADARRLVDFVDSWLAHHIARIDVQIKNYV